MDEVERLMKQMWELYSKDPEGARGIYEEVLKKLEDLASQNNVEATTKLGYLYGDEICFCEHSDVAFDKAKRHLEKAIALGSVEAYAYLGYLYHHGNKAKTSPIDLDKAYALYKEGAEQGDSEAVMHLTDLMRTKYEYVKRFAQDLKLLRQESELLQAHLSYQPGGDCFENVKEHFYSLQS